MIAAARKSRDTSLKLHRIGLTTLPEALGQLTTLQELYLYDNQLTTLPEVMGQLTALRELYLYNNQLTALNELIGRLAALRELYLDNNRLSTLPESLGQLAALQTLSLSDNQLTKLPDSLGQLTLLQSLSLDNNQLTQLPESVGRLTALQWLYLHDNQLATLPEALGQLAALQTLSLSGNRLTKLPELLEQLTALNTLFLHGNEALGIPPEILGPTWEEVRSQGKRPARARDILDYYFKTRQQARPLNEVKLLLVGRGGAGKTSVVRRLRENKFRKGSRETKGISIKPWVVEAGGRRVKVHTWDFAGQVMTHATHQLFFSERSVYVLVLTGRENTEQSDADYWLRLIRAFATERGSIRDIYAEKELAKVASENPAKYAAAHSILAKLQAGRTAPVIIALNKWKAHPCQLDREKLREKYPFITAFVETDCAKGVGIRELKRHVLEAVEKVMAGQQNFPAAWFGIKDAIENDKRDYLTYDEYCELCKANGEADERQQRLLAWALHQLGIALNYGDDPRLCDTTVLDPHWVTGGIYKLLRDAKDRKHPEEMTLDAVARVLPKENPKMRRYLIELMRRYDLAFPMGDDEQRWLVPQRLPESQPRLEDKWFGREVTRVRYRYVALPEGLLPRFITRTWPLSEEQPRWVNGVVLADAGAEVLVRADAQEREVSVAALGPEPARRELTALACNELRRIHADFKGLDPVEEIEPEKIRGTYFPVETLRADEKAHAPTTVPTRSGSVEVSNEAELNRISAPAARDETRVRPRLFISYSRHDARQHDEFLIRLKKLHADGLVETWSDRCIEPGDLWDDRIKAELEAAHIVVFLVSAHSEATDYITAVEIVRAVANARKGKCRVVPVILEKCEWKNTALGEFNALPAKGEAVRDTRPIRDAWFKVQQRLRTLVETVGEEMRAAQSSEPRLGRTS